MYIGPIDRKETARLQKKEKRTSKRLMFDRDTTNKKLKCEADMISKHGDVSNAENDAADDNDGDDDDELHLNDELPVSEISGDEFDEDDDVAVRNTKQYPELCKALDRCKVCNRLACLPINAVLKDMNLLTAETAIDPAKLRCHWRLSFSVYTRYISVYTSLRKTIL